MGGAIGDVVPLAVAVAIFPVPIIAVVLVLGSAQGTRKGLAFVLAWSIGLGAVGALVLLFSGSFEPREAGAPATWLNIVLLALGVLLLALAVKQWRNRPRPGDEPSMPGWMRSIDALTIAKAGATGFALTALNPKNALLTVAAALEIAGRDLPPTQQAAVLIGFVLIGSIGVLAPLVLTLLLGDRSHDLLERLRDWMTRYNAIVMAMLFLVIGAKLIGDSITGFS